MIIPNMYQSFNMQQVPLGSLGPGRDDPDVCRIHLRHLLHLHAILWDTFAGHFLVSHTPGGRSNWRGTEMNWVCFFLQWTCHTGWWLSHPSEKYEFVSWDYYSIYSQYMGNSKTCSSHPVTTNQVNILSMKVTIRQSAPWLQNHPVRTC